MNYSLWCKTILVNWKKKIFNQTHFNCITINVTLLISNSHAYELNRKPTRNNNIEGHKPTRGQHSCTRETVVVFSRCCGGRAFTNPDDKYHKLTNHFLFVSATSRALVNDGNVPKAGRAVSNVGVGNGSDSTVSRAGQLEGLHSGEVRVCG